MEMAIECGTDTIQTSLIAMTLQPNYDRQVTSTASKTKHLMFSAAGIPNNYIG